MGRWQADQKKALAQTRTAYYKLARVFLYATSELPLFEGEATLPRPSGMLLWQAIEAYLVDDESRFRSKPHGAQNISRAWRELLFGA